MAETQAKQRTALRTITGVVTSDKAAKTIKVVVNYQTRHPKYGKYLKRRTVFHAHDEQGQAKEGDVVEIAECRPVSKSKHFRLVRIVQKAPQRVDVIAGEPSAIVAAQSGAAETAATGA